MGCGSAGSPYLVPRSLRTWNQNSSFFHAGKFWSAAPSKAIINEAPAVRGSWASGGTDAWYLGPSEDHYRCNLYYVLEMPAYQVPGSAELFPQHCQVPNRSNTAYLKALTKELTTTMSIAAKMHKGRLFIHKLKIAIDNLLMTDVGSKQRVGANSMAAPPRWCQLDN